MATKTKEVKNISAKAQKLNAKAANFTSDIIEETVAQGKEWQKILSKTVDGSIEIMAQQQDLFFIVLESIKDQYISGTARFKKLISFESKAEKEVREVKKKVVKKATVAKKKINKTVATAKTTTKKAISKTKATTAKSTKKVVKVAEKNLENTMKAVKTPVAITKNNLKLIEGIGPKIEEILNKAGIISFEHLAQTPVAKIKATLEAAGSRYKMHDPSTWNAQAKLAAANKMDELKQWQATNKKGK